MQPVQNRPLKEGFANRRLGREYTGGKLYLYPGLLHYRSHQLNVQVNERQIPLQSIVSVTFFNTLGLVPNGMQLTLNDGTVEKFVVNGRKKWKQALISAGLPPQTAG